MFQNTLKIFVIVMVITITIIPIRISYSQSFDTIEIKTLLKKDDLLPTNLHFHKANLTFGDGSKICPKNNCLYEFENTEFDERVGPENTKYLMGTLQIEDKTKSNDNFISYRYYRLLGTFNLIDIKENTKTGHKVSIYEGNLLLDTGNAMFIPSKIEYKSQLKVYDDQNKLELYGKN